MEKLTAINIVWDTDGEAVNLPLEVKLPSKFDNNSESAVADFLSDKYGWCVLSVDVV